MHVWKYENWESGFPPSIWNWRQFGQQEEVFPGTQKKQQHSLILESVVKLKLLKRGLSLIIFAFELPSDMKGDFSGEIQKDISKEVS